MRTLLLATVLATGAAAAPADLAAELRARLDAAPLVRGSFVQEKTLVGFAKPLVSRGSFVYARELGVIWATERPFPARLAVTRGRLVARDADGRIALELDLGAQRGGGGFDGLLFALVGGDVAALQASFEVEGELRADGRWSLRMQPRDATLTRALRSIALEGGRFVETVRVAESNGDASIIRFADHAPGPPLSPAERAELE